MQRKLGLIIVPQQTKRNQYCVHLSKSRLSFQKMDSANHTQLKHTVNSVFSFFFFFFFFHMLRVSTASLLGKLHHDTANQ